jgi:hypothetical protein
MVALRAPYMGLETASDRHCEALLRCTVHFEFKPPR